MLFREIPFLRICLPLCIGIISGLYIDPSFRLSLLIALISAGMLFTSFFFNKRLSNHVFGFSLTVTLLAAGLILYTIEKSSLSELEKEESLFSGTIDDFPEEKEKSFLLNVRLDYVRNGKDSRALKGSMLIYHAKDTVASSMKPGDRVLFRCTPLPVASRGNPYEFNYRFFLQSKGIKYYSFTGKESGMHVTVPARRSLKHSALILRNRIIEMYGERGVSPERLPLVAALTLGEKSRLEDEQKQVFARAGVMHIMAVSGLHACILALFIFKLLFFMKGRYHVIRILIAVLLLWAFAFVTGLTPSVVRATLMFTFLQAGKLIKREVNPVNSILASAFVLIIIKPSVIFDAGFLLSYSAVMFITGFYRELYGCISSRFRILDLLWQSAAVTITAQAGTLPLTIMLFNRFPLLFLLTNILIVPLSSVIVVAGCLVPLTFPVRHLSGFIAAVMDRLTGLTEAIASMASAIPYSNIGNIGLSVTECIALTAFLSLLLAFLLKRPAISIVYPLVSFMLFMVIHTADYFIKGSSNELIAYNTFSGSSVGIRTGNRLYLYSDKEDPPAEVLRHVSAAGLKLKRMKIYDDPIWLRVNGSSILLTGSPGKDIISSKKYDFIILTGLHHGTEGSRWKQLPTETSVIVTESRDRVNLPGTGNHAGLVRVKLTGAFRQTL